MHGEYKMPGGKLIVADVEVRDGKLTRVQISGDFFLEPDTALAVIDAALEGRPAAAGSAAHAAAVRAALDPTVTLYGISPDAIGIAIERALGDPA